MYKYFTVPALSIYVPMVSVLLSTEETVENAHNYTSMLTLAYKSYL